MDFQNGFGSYMKLRLSVVLIEKLQIDVLSEDPFIGKLQQRGGWENHMSFYTSEYKSDHVTKTKPIRWIYSKQSANKIIVLYQYMQ